MLLNTQSLNKFGILTNPVDLSSEHESLIPINKRLKKVFPSTTTSGSSQITFSFNLDNVDGDGMYMIYLSGTLPPQYATKTSVLCGFQKYAALQLINQTNIKLNDVLYESLTAESIYNLCRELYGDNWETFAKQNIGNSGDQVELMYCKNIDQNDNRSVILPQRDFIIPLPFSLFLNRDKLKLALLDSVQVEVIVMLNSTESAYISNSAMDSFNSVSYRNVTLLINSFEINANVPFKVTPYLSHDASMKPYYFVDTFTSVQKTTIIPTSDIKISFNNSDITIYDLIIRFSNHVGRNNFYYGYNNETAILNYFNTFIFNRVNISIYLFNFKTGTFLNGTNTAPGISISQVNASLYEISVNVNNEQVRTFLKSIKPWGSLQENVYYDFTYFMNNIANNNVLSIFNFNILTFHSIDYNSLEMTIDSSVNDDGNKKFVGGLYLSRNEQEVYTGFINYEISNRVTKEYVNFLASSPVSFIGTNMRNIFAEYNNVRMFDSFNNSYDLDNLLKIEPKIINLTYKNNKSSLDKDFMKLYGRSLEKYSYPLNLLSNFTMENNLFNTNGNISYTSSDSIELILNDEMFENSNYTLNIMDFLRFKSMTLELCLYQKNIRYLNYFNNKLEKTPSTSENSSLIERAIADNFVMKKMKRKKKKFVISHSVKIFNVD